MQRKTWRIVDFKSLKKRMNHRFVNTGLILFKGRILLGTIAIAISYFEEVHEKTVSFHKRNVIVTSISSQFSKNTCSYHILYVFDRRQVCANLFIWCVWIHLRNCLLLAKLILELQKLGIRRVKRRNRLWALPLKAGQRGQFIQLQGLWIEFTVLE